MFDIGFTEDMCDIFTPKFSLEERVKDIRSNTIQLMGIVNPVKCRNKYEQIIFIEKSKAFWNKDEVA